MKSPIIIKLEDLDTSDEALVIVRFDDTSVVVGLSLKKGADIQVVMNKEKAIELIEALKKAVE
jgi:hypothetical protein